MIKKKLEKLIKEVLENENIKCDDQLFLEVPKHSDLGDFSLNISFYLAKTLKKSPKLIAEEITHTLNQKTNLKGIKFSPLNGFINLTLEDFNVWDELINLYETKVIFPKKLKKFHLEYVSANPTGPLHIGHGRWAVLGSVIDHLLTYVGAEVHSEFYINDAGSQIQKLLNSVEAAKNNQPIPEDGYHGLYIHELAKQDKDPVTANIDHQKCVLKQMGVKFQTWFSEKKLFKNSEIETVLKKLKEKNATYEKEGALWFKTSEYGDEKDRVLIKKDGNYTYFAVDIAYHFNKVKRNHGTLLNIWGADHHGYVTRIKAALIVLFGDQFEKKEHFNVILGQMVNILRSGIPVRMSKRSGEMIDLEEVLEEIGIDALRYYLISKSANSHIEFDLEDAKKKSNENPIFYIQYAHARICSIKEKIEIESESKKLETLHKNERTLILHCLKIYDEIWHSAKTFSPYLLAQYTLQLAKYLHAFYETCPIIKAPKNIQNQRLTILNQTQKTLALCLKLLGISAPKRM